MGEIFLETQNRILDPHRASKVSNSGFNGLKSSKLALYRRKKKFAESLSMGHNSWKWVTLWSEKITLWSKKSLYGVKIYFFSYEKKYSERFVKDSYDIILTFCQRCGKK